MAVATATYGPYHDSQGKVNNPTTSTLLADTGAMPSAIYEVRIVAGSSAAGTLNVQHRDSANTGNVSDTAIIFCAAGQSGQYVLKYAVNQNERIRVLPETSITGDVSVTIQAVRVA